MSDDKNLQEESYFEFRDNHGRAYRLPKTFEVDGQEVPLQVLIGHAISKTRKEVKESEQKKYEQIINEYNNLKTEYEQSINKMEEIKTTGMSEIEKKLKEYESKLSQYEKEKQKQAEEAKRNYERWKSEKINTALYGAVSGYDLHNTNHALKVFAQEAKIDVEEADNDLKIKVRVNIPNDKGEYVDIDGSPKDVFSKWIALPSNSYLLKNTLAPGGGTSKTGASRTTSGQLVYKRSQLADPEVRKEYNEKLKKGIDVRIVND